MLRAAHFRWLPNALTISRMILAVAVFGAALNTVWLLAFWLFVVAVLTDFFDGLAAKKLHAQTKAGGVLDLLADFMLAAAGICGLLVTGLFPLWAAVALLIWAVFVGYERWFWRPAGLIHRLRPMASVTVSFATGVFVVWVYVSQAYGWRWWYAPLTLLLLVVAASLKRHRLRAWLGVPDKNAKVRHP